MKPQKKYIQITQTGYGHYRITMDIYGKPFSTITTDSVSIDEYRNHENTIRHNRGYKALCRHLMYDWRGKKLGIKR